MRNLIRLLTLAALATFFALPSLAQSTVGTPVAPSAATPAAPANPCEEAARGDMYTKYYELKGKKDAKGQPDPAAQKEAYDLGKEYLAKYPTCSDTYSKAVQKFIGQYNEAVRKNDFPKYIYGEGPTGTGRDYAKGFALGKEMIAANPNDLNTIMDLGLAGYTAQSLEPPITAYNVEGLAYAKKALELIESGANPTSWAPFKSKEEALGYLNFAAAEYQYFNKDLKGALPYYLKAATYAPTKDIALTYGRLGWAYEAGQYSPLKEEFTAKYKEETEESKFALNNLNQVMDRVMDAYARAIRLAGNDPKFAKAKVEWTAKLTDYYKFRNNNTITGLDAFIAGTASKPLPSPFTPQPYVPAATPAPSTGGTTSDNGSGNGNGAMTTTSATPATTAAPAAPTQPATTTQSTTAAKPKPATKKP
jgi:hypothetical protein